MLVAILIPRRLLSGVPSFQCRAKSSLFLVSGMMSFQSHAGLNPVLRAKPMVGLNPTLETEPIVGLRYAVVVMLLLCWLESGLEG